MIMKEGIVIKRIEAKDYKSLSNLIVSQFYTEFHEGLSIDIIAKYEDAKNIIAEFIEFKFPIVSMFIHDADTMGYDKEFVITISDLGLFCEELWDEEKCLNLESEICYIFDNCSSKIIPYIHSEQICEIRFDRIDYKTDIEVTKNNTITTNKNEEKKDNSYDSNEFEFTIGSYNNGEYISYNVSSNNKEWLEMYLKKIGIY